ncbi:hypothetical protein P3H15_48480 [Rhodococcus sp. T2V]|uniref:Ppx/GppA phosphatase family protein n=1 Tax=Rhodococcus sp. T2V TaxID=3034164 RepID=UPI0023E34E54|nr:hypothetical protein [Rhodococcus sp. T2V]MDF3312781.1 hypothetical protein [Rhodococcus sp. T2V]
MVRLGVLDIGSNSAQLQIVHATPGAPPLPIHAVKWATLLGEAIDADGCLERAGIDRVCHAVTHTMEAARKFEVDQLFTFVTAAIRDAANRDSVLEQIVKECGVRPQFLTGAQEGRLTYIAVHRWYGWSSGRILVIDIGGGSMEIMFGRDAEPEFVLSLPLGAGLLTRTFLHADPPPKEQVKRLRHYVRDTLSESADRLRWEGEPRRVVGTSKTFKQLARLTGAPAQREGPFVRRTLLRSDVHRWTGRLAELPAGKRAELRGISRHRARQIPAGAIVADEAMRALGVDLLEVSPWALREGVILQHLAAVTDPESRLPLQPLTRAREAGSADIMALPSGTAHHDT